MNEMTRLDAALPAAIGHNRPPAPLTPIEVAAWLDDAYSGLTARRDILIETIAAFLEKHPVIETAEVAAAATENLEMARKAIKMGEDQRKIAKEPYLHGGRAVDAWFAAVRADIETYGLALAKPATQWAEKIEAVRRAEAVEAARIAQIEANRLAAIAQAEAEANKPQADGAYDTAIKAAQTAERAEAHAEAKPGVHSRTVGTYGSTSSLRDVWTVTISNPDAIPRAYMTPDMAALNRAVAQGARHIDGCTITKSSALRTRS